MCIPYTSKLSDAPLVRHHYEGDYYAKICKAQFDQLYREGAENGRLMCIAFHPYGAAPQFDRRHHVVPGAGGREGARRGPGRGDARPPRGESAGRDHHHRPDHRRPGPAARRGVTPGRAESVRGAVWAATTAPRRRYRLMYSSSAWRAN
jgi:hypothetical protein